MVCARSGAAVSPATPCQTVFFPQRDQKKGCENRNVRFTSGCMCVCWKRFVKREREKGEMRGSELQNLVVSLNRGASPPQAVNKNATIGGRHSLHLSISLSARCNQKRFWCVVERAWISLGPAWNSDRANNWVITKSSGDRNTINSSSFPGHRERVSCVSV